ncbi:hypothetical protein ACOSQ3_020697 [Xanthoceras sorbifolium]
MSKAEKKHSMVAVLRGPFCTTWSSFASACGKEEVRASKVHKVHKDVLEDTSGETEDGQVNKVKMEHKEVLGAVNVETEATFVPFKFSTMAADKVALDPDPGVLPLKSSKK